MRLKHTAWPLFQPSKGVPPWKERNGHSCPAWLNRSQYSVLTALSRGWIQPQGASAWVAEGNIELSTSCVNRGLPPSQLRTPLFSCLPEARFHLAMESHIQTRSRSFVSERGIFAKEEDPSAGRSRGRAEWQRIRRWCHPGFSQRKG